jgi:p-aminobenzoyl-glutamate transporter AbgT
LSGILRAIWEFVAGEDWRLALGVVVVLGITAILAALGLAAWWVAPVLVPLFLLASLRRALRQAGPS